MTNHLHRGDLPEGVDFGDAVAIDTETMGLNPLRDRLCLVQLSAGDGDAHLVQLEAGEYAAPRLRALLLNEDVTKIFQYARFDIAMLRYHLGVLTTPVWCTKIASKLARTYTDRHGLRELCKDMLGVDISKQQQSSDWGAAELTPQQLEYASNDVLHLHRLRDALEQILVRERRTHLAAAAFAFLPIRAELDLAGWQDMDIFAH